MVQKNNAILPRTPAGSNHGQNARSHYGGGGVFGFCPSYDTRLEERQQQIRNQACKFCLFVFGSDDGTLSLSVEK